MKSKIHFFHIKILVLITLMVVLALHKATANDEPVSIAITPFALNAPEDMAYLKSGIQDMLESRLSQDKNITVISDNKTAQALEGIAEPIDESEARDIGQRLSADFVLIGSLTVFGSSTSLDARLVDVTGAQPTTTFFEQSQKIDELVPKINTVASDITAIMIGSAAAVTTAAVAAPTEAAPDNDAREHPEKIAEDMHSAEEGAADTSPIAITVGGVLSKDFWKSRTFKRNLHGLDLGDVDNDGKVETVVITANTVIIYRNDKGRIFKVGEVKGNMSDYFVGVDIGDINANGFAEIFVTGLNPQKSNVDSFVLEFDGKTYQKIVKGSPWNYRVVKHDQHPPLLLGQKNRTFNPFTGEVFIMHWMQGEYESGNSVLSSKGHNLIGLTYGDVMNNNTDMVLAYDAWDKLVLRQSSGGEEWKSGERLGGNSLNASRYSREKGGTYLIQYLPMRIRIADLDADGKNEVIAVKNHEIAGSHLDQFRHYTKAEISALVWDGLGLSPKWTTKELSGLVRDFAIGDFDNDGKKELVAAIVHKEGSVIATKPKSSLIAFAITGQ